MRPLAWRSERAALGAARDLGEPERQRLGALPQLAAVAEPRESCSEFVVAQALHTTLPEFLENPAAPRNLMKFLERIRISDTLPAHEHAA